MQTSFLLVLILGWFGQPLWLLWIQISSDDNIRKTSCVSLWNRASLSVHHESLEEMGGMGKHH